MKTYEITSSQNKTFKIFEEILNSSGILKHGQALVAGRRVIHDTIKCFPHLCSGLISNELSPPLINSDLNSYVMTPELFNQLDIFGTRYPLLVVKVPKWSDWSAYQPKGCGLLIPFQEPSNVGSALRSAAAFGISDVLLPHGAAHPFHPKSIRASSGAVFAFNFFKCPSLDAIDFKSQSTVALDLTGEKLMAFKFPKDFILIPGAEGPGLSKQFSPSHKVMIPISSKVESLNGPTAVAIALFRWRSVLPS